MRVSTAMCYLTGSLLFWLASSSAFAAVDSGLLALVPQGTKLIGGMDVSRAKDSRFGQYMLARVGTGGDFDTLINSTGFDPRRDLQNFIFASPGGDWDSHASQNSTFAVLARGNFDKDRIRAAVIAKGAAVSSFQGVEIFCEKSDHKGTAFAFPEVGIAAVGDMATVRQIISNRANPTVLDPDLQQLISKASNGNDAWFASLMPGSYLAGHVDQEAGQPMQAQALNSIQRSSGGILFGDVVRISFDAVTRSPKDATSLTDVARLMGSFVQMQRQKDPHADLLASSIDKMTLEAQGNTAHVSLSLPEANLEQMAESDGQHSGASARHRRQ